MKKVKIKTEYITLGKFLKYVGLIDNGALAKIFLNQFDVLVNQEKENRRGRKLYPNDEIKVLDITYKIED